MRRLLCVLPPLVLAAAAGWLAAHWGQVPEHWPLHWGPDGHPDLYAQRTSGVVAFLPMAIGALFWLGFEALAWRLERGPDPHPPLAAATSDLVRAAAVALAVVVGGVGVALPLHSQLAAHRLLPVGIFVGLVLWLGLNLVVYRARTRSVQLPEGYGPLVYANTGDERLWVPKASGLGRTLNMAHPRAWPTLIVLTLLPVITLALLIFALQSTSG
jgi:uncharacterized membrane protein